jgi:hypothetical protein
MSDKKNKKEWIWQCPMDNCLSRGGKATTKERAMENGKDHLRAQHGILSTDGIKPIVVKKDKVLQVSTSFRKAIWVCPVEGCKGHGNKPMRRSKAIYHGKRHMRKRHGIEGEPEVVNVTRNTMKKEIRQRVKKVLINKGVEEERINVSRIS